MPLILNDEQAQLADMARAFLAERSPIALLRKLRDERDPDGFSRDLWAGFAEMGLTGILVSEDHGGLGLGAVEAGVVMEAIGTTLANVPFLSTSILGARALALGSAEQQAAWLPRIAAGEVITALAVDEGAKHRPAAIALTATRSGNGFRLDGTKAMVLDGHVADLLIVAATTGLFLVDPKTRGVTVERTLMVDGKNAARITFDAVEIDADAVLGELDAGPGALEAVLDLGRAAVAAELTGVGAEAFGRTVAYLKERRQFGKLIGEFQALQHRAAILHTELEVAKAVTLKALQAIDAGAPDAALIASAAKAKAGQAAQLAVQEGVQMHGGVGMTDAFDIGFFMKRARVAEELFGDGAFHADRVARASGY
jgi:alkylation response protein AidB-like acyl-CoA dehydrogenase